MNDVTVEDRGKRYLRLSQLFNKEPLLRKDACCGFSLLNASRSTTAVFHQPNHLLCRLTSHLCLTTDFDDNESKKSSQGKARQGFEARALCALEGDRSLYSNSAVVNKQLLGKCHPR
jgi:hypothetical protein